MQMAQIMLLDQKPQMTGFKTVDYYFRCMQG